MSRSGGRPAPRQNRASVFARSLLTAGSMPEVSAGARRAAGFTKTESRRRRVGWLPHFCYG